MARPIEPTPTLSGLDAERFLKEKERIDNLSPKSAEARDREMFFKKCRATYERFKPGME